MKNDSFSGLDHLKRLLWSILHQESTLVSVVCCPRLQNHVDSISSPGAMLMSLAELPLSGKRMSLVCAAAWIHVNIFWLCLHYQGPCLDLWCCCSCGLLSFLPPKAIQISIICTAAWTQVDVLGLCCHWGLHWCSWPMQQHRATEDHTEIGRIFWHQRPCLWSML